MKFLDTILNSLTQCKKHIVLPEANDDRILEAAKKVKKSRLSRITLISRNKDLPNPLKQIVHNFSDVEVVNPNASKKFDEYAFRYFMGREHKGITRKDAEEKMTDPVYFGAMMVAQNDADGMVAGAATETGKILKSAFETVGKMKDIKYVSSSFIMETNLKHFGENGYFVFADAGVNIDPDSAQLAEIGIMSANSFEKFFKCPPRVAFLSFSTKGSASHNSVDKVVGAVNILKSKNVPFQFDGELQADAAIDISVANRKCPESKVGGKANVLVFPDLNAANISYKLVQRVLNISAYGPILQGLAKPINDLSRGCKSDEVYTMIAITCYQAT